jgi:AcrR family transcriptional regulator
MSETPNLRDALIQAGMDLLAEGGTAALTLRQAALRAAPAHHFHGLPGLLTAIAARAFQTFADTLHTARDAAGQDPRARLLGTCQGYLTFAARHSGLFHLMFVSTEVDRSDLALAPAALRAYQILSEACRPFATHADDRLEVAVWSLVHGYASLGFCGPTPPNPMRHAPQFAEILDELLRS